MIRYLLSFYASLLAKIYVIVGPLSSSSSSAGLARSPSLALLLSLPSESLLTILSLVALPGLEVLPLMAKALEVSESEEPSSLATALLRFYSSLDRSSWFSASLSRFSCGAC